MQLAMIIFGRIIIRKDEFLTNYRSHSRSVPRVYVYVLRYIPLFGNMECLLFLRPIFSVYVAFNECVASNKEN